MPRAFQPLLGKHRYKGAWGGRGSAKSHFFVGEGICWSVRRPGLRVVCIREIQLSLKQSVKRLVEDKIEAFGIGPLFSIQETQIILPGDGLMIFQGMQNHTAESIKSLEGYDLALVEEGQSLSQRSLDLLRPTLRKEDSELWFAWNPLSPTDPVDKLFRSADKPPGAAVIKANYRDNPFFPDVLRAEMEWDKRRDPDKYNHVWLGEYLTRSGARVFKNWRIDEFDTDKFLQKGKIERFYYGADWGFSVDPTVLVRCFIIGRTLYFDYEAWGVGCEIDHTPALFDKVPGSRKYPITADSANPQSISYMRRNGFPKIEPSVKGPGSIEEGVEFLKGYDIVIHPRCVNLIDEFSTYSYEIDPKTEEVLPKLADKKNHTIDSARYAVEKVRRVNAPATFGTYGTR